MNKTKHTPGPWIIRQGDEWTSSIVTNDGVNALGEPMYWEVASYNLRRAECRANAHLIAAAPELLAALILAKDMMIANDLSLPYTFEVIDDAIAKAKGE